MLTGFHTLSQGCEETRNFNGEEFLLRTGVGGWSGAVHYKRKYT